MNYEKVTHIGNFWKFESKVHERENFGRAEKGIPGF